MYVLVCWGVGVGVGFVTNMKRSPPHYLSSCCQIGRGGWVGSCTFWLVGGNGAGLAANLKRSPPPYFTFCGQMDGRFELGVVRSGSSGCGYWVGGFD